MDKRISILEQGSTILQEKNNLAITKMLGEAYYDKALVSSDKKIEYYNKSLAAFSTLLSSGYERPYIYRNMAIIYEQTGDFTKSEETLLKMKSLYPEDYTCYMQLALLYADIENKKPNESRNYQKTADNYQLAVKYSPNGESNQALLQLKSLINELKAKNWIK